MVSDGSENSKTRSTSAIAFTERYIFVPERSLGMRIMCRSVFRLKIALRLGSFTFGMILPA